MPIHADCPECEKPHTLADNLSGKRVKCKGCGAAFTVPEPEAAPGRKRRRDEDADEPDRERERPPRKRRGEEDERREEPARPRGGKAKSSSGLLLLLLGGAALLLLVCGGGVTAIVLVVKSGGGGGVAAGAKPTPENFAKVKRGMTEAEVVALMGPPQPGVVLPNNLDDDVTIGLPDARTKRLGWKDSDGIVYRVVLFDGTAQVAFGTDGRSRMLTPILAEESPILADFFQQKDKDKNPKQGETKPLDRDFIAAFGKLRKGMNEAEVVALLGPATNRNVIPAQQFGNREIPASVHLTWGQLGGDHVNATLRADKLTTGFGSVQGQKLKLTQ